jgi:F0F1-type ATP synthase assembly protein I
VSENQNPTGRERRSSAGTRRRKAKRAKARQSAWEMTAGALVGLIIGTFGSALIWGWPW